MKNDNALNKLYSRWIQQTLISNDEMAVANIRFHLNVYDVPSVLREDYYRTIARRFRNSFSKKFRKGVRRNKNFLPMVAWTHLEQRRHIGTNAPHIHILTQYPRDKSIEEVKNIVDEFCQKETMNPDTGQLFREIKSGAYCEDARDTFASGFYNSGEGEESMTLLL
jgi:hypothetical protein